MGVKREIDAGLKILGTFAHFTVAVGRRLPSAPRTDPDVRC